MSEPQTDRGRNLTAAHFGYAYQDLFTAYFFALGLLKNYGSITVDLKAFEADRFDDLTILSGSARVKRQLKTSPDNDRIFTAKYLTTTMRDMRIDDLVRSFLRDENSTVNEYRICTSLMCDTNPDFVALLERVDSDVSFAGHQSKCYRLRANLIWPENQPALWGPLNEATDFGRKDFINFSRKFLLEVECPQASLDLRHPGQLETLLLRLLADGVGIGVYPNDKRNLVDAAASLIQRASQARQADGARATLFQADIENSLQLQKDFGRVSQEFPLDESVLVKRKLLSGSLREKLDAQRLILTGPPGSGKSWALTELIKQLKQEGYLVAHHYCFLEPGDEQVQQRITTNALFGNLIYDLIQAKPELRGKHLPAYSAGLRELEELLKNAVMDGLVNKVILVVDGLDHISRVFADARDISAGEVDIVKELAALDLPREACLIIGSQPGRHLEPLLGNAVSLSMPEWEEAEVANLARRFDIPIALERAGISNSTEAFLTQLHRRSEGNPLYATFLCKQTQLALTGNQAFDPIEFLQQAPQLDGEISRYYDWLLQTVEAGPSTIFVAELLGLIDFGLSESELGEIRPDFAHRLPQALAHLDPILTKITAQGGFRIYHESFRRYITERIRTQGGSIAAVVKPVINWLKNKEFFEDARAYRFLLPCLRRAGRNKEALEVVNAVFLSRSVGAGFSRRAIEENLKLTAYIAAEEQDWAAFARLAELHSSCWSCFEQKLLDFELFGKTFANLFGAKALNERLLFDGKPTFPPQEGLLLCSLCDDAGQVAPWLEYLDSNIKAIGSEKQGSADDNWVKYATAQFHGELRTFGLENAYTRVLRWLEKNDTPSSEYLRNILERLVQFGGSFVLTRLLEEAKMTAQVTNRIKTELAKALFIDGEERLAKMLASEVIRESNCTELALECIALGANLRKVQHYPQPKSVDIGLDKERVSTDLTPIKLWVETVRLAAVISPADLSEELIRIKEVNWYRNWLRFVIALSQAEVQAKRDAIGAESSIVAALTNLASDTRSFAGEPRACDLYFVHPVIHQTLARALRLLHSTEAWIAALGAMAKMAREMTTSLQNSHSGPLKSEAYVDLLLPYVTEQGLYELIISEIRKQIEATKAWGEFYETFAHLEMQLALALNAGGQKEEARKLWRSVAIQLCGYGFRADTTIYELLESAPFLGQSDLQRAREALTAVQPLVNAVVQHTDGKETKYAPIYWVEALCKVDLVAGAYVLARTLVKNGGRVDWRCEESLAKIIDAAREIGEPSLLFFLESTLPFGGEPKDAEKRLLLIDRLIKNDPSEGEQTLKMLAAQIQGDSERFNETAYEKLHAFAKSNDLPLLQPTEATKPRDEQKNSARPEKRDPIAFSLKYPIFPDDAELLDVMKNLRSVWRTFREEDRENSRLVNAIGFRLVELLQSDAEEDALRLLRCFARESLFYHGAEPLKDLADGLERHGYSHAASFTLMLAYSHSRSGGGYLHLGGTEQLPWLSQALALSPEDAAKHLAGEIVYWLNEQGATRGITRNLVEACEVCELKVNADSVWQAAFEVIRHRLPGSENEPGIIEAYLPTETPDWSVDESLVALLLARVSHPELKRKTTALAGLMAAIEKFPHLLKAPLRHFFNVDTPVSSFLLVLQALLDAEQPPFLITLSLQEHLQCMRVSGLFSLRVLAQELLERAGVEPAPFNSRADYPLFKKLPNKRIHKILLLDRNELHTRIARVWPEFPQLVARRFEYLWESSQTQKDRAQTRCEIAVSRRDKNIDPVRVLLWEKELFECAFNEVLEGIDEHLWSLGLWDSETLPELVTHILPNTRLHLAKWHARSVRPRLPRPSEQVDQITSVETLDTNDEYQGWVRCGYFERELLAEGWQYFNGYKTAIAGIEFPNSTPDPTVLPLAEGDAEAWLRRFKLGSISTRPFVGPLVGLDQFDDWLGSFPVLGLQPNLIAALQLEPYLVRGFELVDGSHRLAVKLRYWRMRPLGESINDEQYKLVGCDLIVRPDIFERIVQRSSGTPLWVKKVIHSNRE